MRRQPGPGKDKKQLLPSRSPPSAAPCWLDCKEQPSCKETPGSKHAAALSYLKLAHHAPFLVRVAKAEGHVAQRLGAGLYGHWLIVTESVILKRAGHNQLGIDWNVCCAKESKHLCVQQGTGRGHISCTLADGGKPTTDRLLLLANDAGARSWPGYLKAVCWGLIQAVMLWGQGHPANTWTVEAVGHSGGGLDNARIELTVQAHLCLHPRPVYEGFGVCCQPAHGHADVLINLSHLFDAGGLLQAHSV